MKKSLILTFLPLILLAPIHTAFAESSASVNIQSNVNANSNSTSNVTSHTSITTEVNGKVTHYESDKPNQNVSVKAVNGESTINVDGSIVTSSPTHEVSPTPSEETKKVATPTSTLISQNKIKEIIETRLNFIKKFFDFLKSLQK